MGTDHAVVATKTQRCLGEAKWSDLLFVTLLFIFRLYFRRISLFYTSKYDNTDSTHSHGPTIHCCLSYSSIREHSEPHSENPELSSCFLLFSTILSGAPLARFSWDKCTDETKQKQHWSYFNDYVLYYCYNYQCFHLISFDDLFCLSHAELQEHERGKNNL